MSKSDIKNIYGEDPHLPDLIYYNMQIFNGGTVPMNATFKDTRNQSICNDPSKYDLSVVRFSAPGNSIPIFNVDSTILEQEVEIAGMLSSGNMGVTGANYLSKWDSWAVSGTGIPANTTISNVLNSNSFLISNNATSSGLQTLTLTPPDNALTYTVTITANGIDSTSNVIFNSLNDYNPNGVYSYQAFLDMINEAFQTSFSVLTAKTAVYPDQPPRLYYDPKTLLISMYLPNNYRDTGINIYMNFPLFQFMGSFKNEFIGYNIENGKDYRFLIDGASLHIPPGGASGVGPWSLESFILPDDVVENSPGGTGGYTYLVLTQEFQTLNDWNDLESIVFTSNSMKTQPEFIPSLGQQGQTTNTNDNSQPILTDFVPVIEGAGLQRSQFVYNPTGEYRMISLNSNTAIKQTDLQVHWTESNGRWNDFKLEPGFGLSIKFLFRKRGTLYK